MVNMRLGHFIMNDQWPGYPDANIGIPTNGWDNTVDNFNTSDDTAKALDPPQPIGQKRTVYQDSSVCPGNYTMMYLVYHDVSDVDVSADYSDGLMFCCHVDCTKSVWNDTSDTPYFVVSRCYTGTNFGTRTDATRGLPIAIPCATVTADSSLASTITDPYVTGFGDAYGWFWVGGVCPVKDVTLFRGTADSLLGADITVYNLIPGAVYCEISSGNLKLNTGDMTDLFDETLTSSYDLLPPVGWVCVSAS
jgi:hypothetical protein